MLQKGLREAQKEDIVIANWLERRELRYQTPGEPTGGGGEGGKKNPEL